MDSYLVDKIAVIRGNLELAIESAARRGNYDDVVSCARLGQEIDRLFPATVPAFLTEAEKRDIDAGHRIAAVKSIRERYRAICTEHPASTLQGACNLTKAYKPMKVGP